jgi:two-component system response regulator YesN
MRPRIFLVDDEQPVLDGLTVTIKKHLDELEICGTARSGKDAIEGILQEKPDIVMMDVRMPGMSGLDALRELRRLASDSVTILLTAYERFDIAKEAFSLGVYDYLVKPVEQEALISTLKEALRHLKELKDASFRAASARQELELARPLLEVGFIYTAILGPQDPSLLRSFGQRLALMDQRGKQAPEITGHFAVLAEDPETPFPWTEGNINLLRQAITNRLACLVGPPLGGFLPLFIQGSRIESSMAILKELFSQRDFPVLRFAVGSVREGIDLRRSWADALGALASKGENRGDTIISRRFESQDPTREELRRSEQGIIQGDLNAATTAFAHWILLSSREDENSKIQRALVAAALTTLAGASVEDAVQAGISQWIMGNEKSEDFPERAANLLTISLGGTGTRKSEGGFGELPDKRIRSALRFIGENYHRPISLEEVAETVGLSPAHLSRILVAETGSSFTDHISRYRIERAKRELTQGSLSVKEIAYVCGYPDANYFSRAFKKIVGITPSEYAHTTGGPSYER